MVYQLNIEAIKKNFKFDTSIKHNPKTELEFLPYNTNFKDNHYNLREVTGEFIRLVGKKKVLEVVDTDQLINKVVDSITFQDINQRSEFKQIIKTLFLDENNQLYLFHPQTLYYIHTKGNENKRLAIFLYNILWDSENAWIIESDQQEYSDVMSKLLFKALPQLTNSEIKNKSYISMLPDISKLFRQDFKWLISKNELFTTQVDQLIAYYYFFYITQFSIRNESLFKPIEKNIRPVYFTFENEERLSKTRISYEYGWKNLESLIDQTFTHINFLKMLNFTMSNEDSHAEQDSVIFSYQKIAEEIYSMSSEEQDILNDQIITLIEEYKEKLSHDSKWELLGTISEPYDLPVLNTLYLLFNMIDHQFVEARSGPYNKYKQWFVNFCQKTFLKSRGRSGKMLILDTDYLLFLTKLIIKDESKIRLKNLFIEFEIRGIIFDRDTQEAIVDYFEKLNLLEKKSDSGDAIYVKAFL
ncbi:DNA phosphorothioation-dependent restriction protein DptG [Paenibacillus kyungheensis]|uniref:DNA phosphorothioation-dependent restriction protein DptG n=1 Tax=Paenibacillus kyungheensis TaxID=1452732 RepID=A0AAX3M613_9BACL|nr:DNA phosphorothioation-dependent restriction protein DptG [Paenibacillus kyungheensis]WCT56773.1 DNA phosphorothioation-dependent restriction protein DptG [Paenibacillus kyungheensis]